MTNFLYKNTASKIVDVLSNNFNIFINNLISEYVKVNNENPDPSQVKAWNESFQHLLPVFSKINPDLNIIVEYALPMSKERCDIIILGKDNNSKAIALVIELKGWHQFGKIQDGMVNLGNLWEQHPERQVLNYVGKLTTSHSAFLTGFDSVGVIFMYNLNKCDISVKEVNAYFENEVGEFSDYINQLLPNSIGDDLLTQFIDGKYIQNPHLFEAISTNFDNIKMGFDEMLLKNGVGPTLEQDVIMKSIIDSARNQEKVAYFISGSPGSGKTYLAIFLLLKAFKKYYEKDNFDFKQQNIAILGYRNNRLLNSLKDVFKNLRKGIDNIITYYSIGEPNSNFALAEGNPNSSDFTKFKIAIFDEAQRMNKKNIEISLQRADVTVFFFDEKQILHIEDEGLLNNFVETAKILNIKPVPIELENY